MKPRLPRFAHARWWLVAAFGGLIAVAVLLPVYRVQGLAWLEAILGGLLFVGSCAMLSWLTWRALVSRVQLLRERSPTHVLAFHAAAAVSFSLAWLALSGSGVYFLNPESMAKFLPNGAIWQFLWGLVVYGALAQAAHARGRLREQDLAAAAAELRALRAQLNPHFLFNTLHSLTQLAREDPVATQDALERFGELMRYVLDAGRDAAAGVSLEDELRFIRNYLAIERLRLGDRLRIVEQIDEDALDTVVPPLLLQPLVENAVRHGLAPRRGGGTIWLTARMLGDVLILEVADDGEGAEPDGWWQSQGLGLKSVARQLRARFPRAAELEVTAKPHSGFAVRLEIPT